MGAPAIRDVDTLIAAGIDPKTGKPLRTSNNLLKESIRKLFRIVDEQDAINRFTWYNLPEGLDGQLLERVLYYKGEGAFFYIEEMNKFYFLPYALDGSIDVYGRYTGIRPVPFNGSTQDINKEQGKLKVWLNTQIRKPEYSVVLPTDLTVGHLLNSCVLLKDYSEQISQNVIPRQQLQDPLLDVMSDLVPFMRTSLLNSTGVSGMRVGSEEEQSNVEAASASVNNAALRGKKWIPIVGSIDFQDLTATNVANSEEFLVALQSLENLRVSMYGIPNAGIMSKKEHMLQSEQDMNTGSVGLVLQDGLANRQRFCNIVNSIWGLGIWCDVSETVAHTDTNGDGQIQDDKDQSGVANSAPEDNGGSENVGD